MIIQSYNDICSKISALNIWIDSLERDIKYYTKLLHGGAPKDISGMSMDGMPKGSRNDMTIDRIIESIHKAESHLYLAEEEKKCKEQQKKQLEEVMSNMEGLEYKVYYYRVVKGMTQLEAAEELGKSDRHIRRIEKVLRNVRLCPSTIAK
jgi:DNA-directed RNA polymerase specialized sigma24 family protein